jgi:hypothetical protein
MKAEGGRQKADTPSFVSAVFVTTNVEDCIVAWEAAITQNQIVMRMNV